MKCTSCGGPKTQDLCAYCGVTTMREASEPKRRIIKSDMSNYKLLKDVELIGDMNTIKFADNCIVRGDMNTIHKSVDTEVVGDMNTHR